MMVRYMFMALALIAAATAEVVKTPVVMDNKKDIQIGTYFHDDIKTGKRPGIIIVSYDGKINEFAQSQAEVMTGIADGSRVMLVDMMKAIGSDRKNISELTNTELSQGVKKAIEIISTCSLCLDSVDTTKIAVIGHGLGANALFAAIKRNVSFHVGVAYTPMLDSVEPLDKGKKYSQKLLIIPGYDSIELLDDFEKNKIEQTLGMLQFEIFMQHSTKVHFNVHQNSNYRPDQAQRAREQAASFMEAVFKGTFDKMGTEEPAVNAIAPDQIKYPVGNAQFDGIIVRDKKLGTRPAVLVVPAFRGFSSYEISRMQGIAKMGYVAMSANIYGLKIGETLEFDESIAKSLEFRANASADAKEKDTKGALFNDRIAAAYKYLQTQNFVSSQMTSVIGFCLGGSGVYNAYRYEEGMQLFASFHGGMVQTRDFSGVKAANFMGYLAMYSGTQDDGESGSTLISHLADISKFKGKWELTRYSNTGHGFTDWSSSNYNPFAEGRAFESFAKLLERKMPNSSIRTSAASLFWSLLAASIVFLLSDGLVN